jgi:hypothetical protein
MHLWVYTFFLGLPLLCFCVSASGLLSDIYHCFVLRSESKYRFYSFPSESCIELFFFKESGFHPFFFLSLNLVLCNYAFDRIVVGFDCLFSFT